MSAFAELTQLLTPRYGAGEAQAVARIAIEDAFGAKQYKQFIPISASEQAKWERIQKELLEGVPVQYVVGIAEFYGLRFEVSPAVLIPRQETEELIHEAIQRLKGTPNPKILDIGIGSGCIGIALAKNLPGAALFGIEKSDIALALAQKNAEKLLENGTQVEFLLADVLTDDFEQWPQFDLIVSNPPYIPRSESALMPEHVLAHEPEMALFVEGNDALLFYRRIVALAQKKLVLGGILGFECNEFNAREVLALVTTQEWEQAQLLKDLSGADRMVFAQFIPAT
jgi:release factor glutamine methyltransferase